MKYLAPRSIPALSQIVPALGDPSPRELARYLDVTERTVYRWQATDDAPRAVLLSLFWESSYGLSTLDAELFNSVAVYKNLSESLNHEAQTLRVRIARLEKIGSFASANAPYLVPAVLPVSAF